jgi:probable rRNA maturation factor
MAKALSALACEQSELSLLFTDNEQIAVLNARYLGRPGPTNVIAFPMLEEKFSEIRRGMLGDIVISLERAQEEALELGLTLEERVDQLLVHGLLHLLGHDHETTPAAARKMQKAEVQLLAIMEEE